MRGPALLVVLVASGTLLVAACASPTPTEVLDAYGNRIPGDEALDVLVASAQEILQEEDWGLPPEKKCVGLNPNWGWDTSGREMIPAALLERLAKDLTSWTSAPVYVVDEEGARKTCLDRFMTQLVTFDRLRLWKGSLYVRVRERCETHCWGGSDWEYEFVKQDGRWKLHNSTGLGMA